MKKSNLDLLAQGLHIASLDSQKLKVGGFDYSTSLPEVEVTAPYPEDPPSFDWSGIFGNSVNSDASASGGSMEEIGGSVGGSNIPNNGSHDGEPDRPDATNINDSKGLLDKTKDWLKNTIDAVEKLIKDDIAPKGSEDYLEKLKETQSTLENMSNDKENKYRIDEAANNGDNNLDAYVSYDSSTGEVVLALENIPDVNNISLIAHEIEHIQQIMDGDLYIKDGEIKGYDIYDEVDAYQRQHDLFYGKDAPFYDLNGNHVPEGDYKVTPEDIYEKYPGIYDDLPKEKTQDSNDRDPILVWTPSSPSASLPSASYPSGSY